MRFLLFLLVLCSKMSIAQQVISIGIISDLDQEDDRGRQVYQMIEEEIQRVTGSAYHTKINASDILNSNRDAALSAGHYKELASRCDLVLLIGTSSIQGALQHNPITTPTLALGVFDPELQQIPYINGTSGVENFSYVLSTQNMEEELLAFKTLAHFERLALLFDQRTMQSHELNLSNVQQRIKQLEQLLNVTISSIPIDVNDIEQSLSKIPTDADAAYLAVPYEFTPQEASAVFKGINERKIPSLSMNQLYINQGALFSFSKDNGIEYIVRKLAIMADDALNGENLAAVQVNVNKKEELFFNLNTARTIEYAPSFETLYTSTIVGEEKNDTPSYSLQEILKIALEENLAIQLSNIDIALRENDVRYAKSNFLPDVDARLSGLLIDQNRTNPVLGQAEQSVSTTGQFQQLIYSESAIATIQIQKYLKEAQLYATEQEILTQVLNCFNAYFSVLRAKTFLAIQEENLAAYKTNLELSKVGVNVGARNNIDVYRWESELANAKQENIEARTNLILAKLQLNNLLNNKLEREFDIKDVSLDDDVFSLFSNSALRRSIESPVQLNILADFLVEESKANYPAKKELLSNLSAIERQNVMNKRLFYTPAVALTGQIDQNIYRGGMGSEPLPEAPFFNTTWSTALAVSIPIFDGYRRKINLQETRIQQEKLETQIESLDQQLALQVRANTLQVLASNTAIGFSKISAENAENNFKLIQDNYKQGIVTITQLIDAQRSSIAAKQSYFLSVYNFLLSFLTLENSVGFYSMLSSEKEKEEFIERFNQYILNL